LEGANQLWKLSALKNYRARCSVALKKIEANVNPIIRALNIASVDYKVIVVQCFKPPSRIAGDPQ
jgi:hypothetical protein